MLLNFSIPLSIRFASAIITVSENTRKDILAGFPSTPSRKITATPLAVGPAFKPLDPDEVVAAKKLISERYGLDGEYALSVGVLQPRKNLPLLIEAFVRAKRQAGFTLKLAIVGKVGWLSADTLAAISLAGDAVQMLGYVPDADLPLLYGCANIMAYPSTYEGFGLPALEAMACGCPVMAGNNSSLPEVVGEAGMLLPADSLTSWREAFVSLAENASERSKMRIRGLARASTFSWEETARRTLEVYRSVSTKE